MLLSSTQAAPEENVKQEQSDLVSHVEDVLELLAHSVVLGGEEGRVQHDEQRHARIEQLRTDHHQSSWGSFPLKGSSQVW